MKNKLLYLGLAAILQINAATAMDAEEKKVTIYTLALELNIYRNIKAQKVYMYLTAQHL